MWGESNIRSTFYRRELNLVGPSVYVPFLHAYAGIQYDLDVIAVFGKKQIPQVRPASSPRVK